MEGSLRNKLLQHEVAPPAAVWDRISQQLDEEFIPSDAVLSMKMENASVVPPFDAWNNIADAIQPQKTKTIPLYRRIAVAAAVLALIALSGVYFLSDNDGTSTPTTNTVTVNNNIAEVPPPATEAPLRDTTAQPSQTLVASNRIKRSGYTRPASSSVGNRVQSEQPYLTYAELEMEPVPVQAEIDMQPVEVQAPPIRDARGNIIMDYSVIRKPNDPYITITSPNGSQTKISSKFLHCLSYLNGDFSSSEINTEGMQWKNRFEEWRSKLLSEGAFVPAANNFFDIFELKELIEEQ